METPHGVISAFFTGFAVKLAMDAEKKYTILDVDNKNTQSPLEGRL